MLRRNPFVSGEYYHLFNRGVDKRFIFDSGKDYRRFVMLLYVANSPDSIRLDHLLNVLRVRYENIFQRGRGDSLISIGAWCLMQNHFHMVVRQEKEGGISTFMKKIGTGYSMYFNIKYERVGNLFSGPFQSRLVDSDPYLRHLFGYVHLNPIGIKTTDRENPFALRDRRKLERILDRHTYSSYHDHRGRVRPENAILCRDAFPDYFSRPSDFQDFIDSYLSFIPD